MSQPIIDPDKVSAWTASVRGVFGASDLGTWLVIGFVVAFLAFAAFTTWSASRQPKHRL